MAKKNAKTYSDPTPPRRNYLIQVDVDADGNFTYKANGIPNASTIKPLNGETVQWVVRVRNKPQPFTIEFPGNGPFGVEERVIRSFGKATKPRTVKVSPFFKGNLCMKYQVSLTNGWTDDPDIVPSPFDSNDHFIVNEPILLSLDATDGHLVVTQQDATRSAGIVSWKWDGEDLDEFTLTFDPPVPEWPTKTESQGSPDRIDLNLRKPAAPGARSYTISTPDYGKSATCTLTIT